MEVNKEESLKESEVNQINLSEKYLINKLRIKYDTKCLNKIAGGGGQRHNKGDNHKIYIMYK